MAPGQRDGLGLPPFPRTQALSSTTFRPPPLDGSLTVPELYDWHYENSPHHPLFIYSDEDGSVSTIYWPEATKAVHRAGRLATRLVSEGRPRGSSRPVLAILAGNESITYYTLMAGICRAGFTAFPVSPRNSATAIAHLLKQTGSSHVFVSDEEPLQNLARAALELMEDTDAAPTLCSVPSFEELYPKDDDSAFEFLPAMDVQWDDPIITLHSSGSTAFPKPIVWTHDRYLLGCLAPWFGERDLTGQRLAFHSMPMFHGLGMMQIGWTAFSGLVLTVFKPQAPPMVPTPESVMRGAIDTNSDFIFCVPSFIEAWASNPADVDHLKTVEGIIYGGGPLSQGVGDELASQGVAIFTMYGISETGIQNMTLPRVAERDWQYFAMASHVNAHFVPDGEGHFELVIVTSQFQKPCVVNTKVDGVDAYATSDLLIPHPTRAGYWKMYGRADDQIMHSTGEKTNPGPLENILNRDPHIQAAVMFGRGKFNAGILVDPRLPFKFDSSDQEKLAEFRNLIWPTVEKLNAYAPQHSRIFKEMIIVSSPDKPFMYTAKNTARRQAILQDYETEIEELYSTVEETAQAELSPPLSWDIDSTTAFVRLVVNRVLTSAAEDDDDLFRKGCDSLQATWIRNSLVHALKSSTDVSARQISNNVVYENPSITRLAVLLTKLVVTEKSVEADQDAELRLMLDLVEKYSTSLPIHTADHLSCDRLPHDVVLLTGTTGGYGSSLLGELVNSAEVSLIYALNRKGKTSIRERQRAAFQERDLDETILDSPKIILVESDLHKERLGLANDIYEELRSRVTHIIHNGWTVNFNMSLSSFESNIQTMRRLMDLALLSPHSSPPRLVFVSSVSVLASKLTDSFPLADVDTPGGIDRSTGVREEEMPPLSAVGSGYAASKWVAEKLCCVVREQTPLRPICVRVGQICGSDTGAWNPSEWLPSLVRSSVYLKCLPSWDIDISLLPADDAARALLEMRDGDVPFLHMVHPHPTAWSIIMEPIAQEFDLQRVPFDEWVSLLEKSGRGRNAETEVATLRENPALKLLQFFVQCRQTEYTQTAVGLQGLDTSEAQRISSTLRNLQPVDGEHARRWVAYWKRHGHL